MINAIRQTSYWVTFTLTVLTLTVLASLRPDILPQQTLPHIQDYAWLLVGIPGALTVLANTMLMRKLIELSVIKKMPNARKALVRSIWSPVGLIVAAVLLSHAYPILNQNFALGLAIPNIFIICIIAMTLFNLMVLHDALAASKRFKEKFVHV